MDNRRKQIHVNFLTEDQIADYEYARQLTGIRNDADLVRFLLRRFRLHSERELVDTRAKYETADSKEA